MRILIFNYNKMQNLKNKHNLKNFNRLNINLLNINLLNKRHKNKFVINQENKEKLKKRFSIDLPDFKSVLINKSEIENKPTPRTNYVSRVKKILSLEIKKYSMIRLPYNLKNRKLGFKIRI